MRYRVHLLAPHNNLAPEHARMVIPAEPLPTVGDVVRIIVRLLALLADWLRQTLESMLQPTQVMPQET